MAPLTASSTRPSAGSTRSGEGSKPMGRDEKALAPRFELIMTTVLEKSVDVPQESDSHPTSRTSRKVFHTVGCAFSISSSRTAVSG